MSKEKDKSMLAEKLQVLQNLKKNPYHKFNNAFALMSILPLLILLYIIVAKLFTIDILVGSIGLFVTFAIFVAIAGYLLTHDILGELIAHAAKLRMQNTSKSKFITNISHDLKNPLSIIMGNIENMAYGIYGDVNDKQKETLEMCQDVAERMNRLTNNLLKLHKVESGMVKNVKQFCNLSTMLERQKREFGVSLKDRDITIKNETPEADFYLWADRGKILRVINNLLGNAIKYTPSGGHITLTFAKKDDFLEFEVHNEGAYIPEDKLDVIFDRYKRLDSAEEGLGLGLAIAKDIVSMHKGSIWAESSPALGNKFTVKLPCNLKG